MALVNAFSSLSLAAPKAAGLGFKKAVAAFAQPAARVSGARVAFAVEAKQNKKARVIQVRSAPRTGHGARERTSRARVFVDTRVHAREPRSARAVSRRVAPNARARRAMYQNPRTRLFCFVFFFARIDDDDVVFP
jgi:chorismate synthase